MLVREGKADCIRFKLSASQPFHLQVEAALTLAALSVTMFGDDGMSKACASCPKLSVSKGKSNTCLELASLMLEHTLWCFVKLKDIRSFARPSGPFIHFHALETYLNHITYLFLSLEMASEQLLGLRLWT